MRLPAELRSSNSLPALWPILEIAESSMIGNWAIALVLRENASSVGRIHTRR